MRFKTDWASLIALPFLLCFALYLRATSKFKPPWGAYIQGDDLREVFLRYEFGGLIFGILRYSINILSDKLCFNFGAKIYQRQLQNWYVKVS